MTESSLGGVVIKLPRPGGDIADPTKWYEEPLGLQMPDQDLANLVMRFEDIWGKGATKGVLAQRLIREPALAYVETLRAAGNTFQAERLQSTIDRFWPPEEPQE